jgi:hypothetical protein
LTNIWLDDIPLDFSEDIEVEEPQEIVVEPDENRAHPSNGVIYVDAPPEPPLDRTKIYIQRHPYSRTRPTVSPKPPTTSQRPYWPFKTQEDFELAEICIDAGLPTKTIERLVGLFHRVQSKPGSITVRNAKQMMETMDRAAQFTEDRVRITYNSDTFAL